MRRTCSFLFSRPFILFTNSILPLSAMSSSKNTRSKVKQEKEDLEDEEDSNSTSKTQNATISALRKVFYIPESLLDAAKGQELHLERFYHPGKNRTSLFVVTQRSNGTGTLLELLEHAEPLRSWLINDNVCSNGRIYITTPIDCTFLALHLIRKHCQHKALSLDSIEDEKEPNSYRLLTQFVRPEHLKSIADVKTAGDMTFYKYNPTRAMVWLTLKTKQVMKSLKIAKIYCGQSAVSQNYMITEADEDDENRVHEMDYMRIACDIVGDYIDLDLHEELKKYLEIPNKIEALVDEKAQKRKSQQNLNSKESKKIKLDTNGDGDLTDKLKNSSLLDSSIEETKKPKERSLSAKEKSFAKGAKGTKSIASFFKKV